MEACMTYLVLDIYFVGGWRGREDAKTGERQLLVHNLL